MKISYDEPVHPLTVRFPESILQALRAQAKAHQRSLNAEIVFVLQQTVKAAPKPRRTPALTHHKEAQQP